MFHLFLGQLLFKCLHFQTRSRHCRVSLTRGSRQDWILSSPVPYLRHSITFGNRLVRDILDFPDFVVSMFPCMWHCIVWYIHQGRAGLRSRYSDSLGARIESRWARLFLSLQTGPDEHPASCTKGTRSFPRVSWLGRGVAWRWPSTLLQRRGYPTSVRLLSIATSSAPIRRAGRPPVARSSGVNRRELVWQRPYNVCCFKGYFLSSASAVCGPG